MIRTKNRMCTGKVRHKDMTAAEDALQKLVDAGAARSRLKAYRCDHCGLWHVGHVGRRR